MQAHPALDQEPNRREITGRIGLGIIIRWRMDRSECCLVLALLYESIDKRPLLKDMDRRRYFNRFGDSRNRRRAEAIRQLEDVVDSVILVITLFMVLIMRERQLRMNIFERRCGDVHGRGNPCHQEGNKHHHTHDDTE